MYKSFDFCQARKESRNRKDNGKMENNQQQVPLTSAEISSLWTAYQADTLNIYSMNFFLTHVADEAIRQVLAHALEIAKKRNEAEIQLFNSENHPIPQGFTEKDINFNAPRLFSDKLYLQYTLYMTYLDMIAYSTGLSMGSRTDMMHFFSESLSDVQDLHQQAKELAKEKGIYIRPPQIPTPQQIEFVKEDRFLAGWFGERRPLLGTEIAMLAYNSDRNALGQAVITGFSQVAENKEVKHYFERGREISGKHYDIFSDILHENYLSDGILLTAEVSESTVAPFSDKLMMNFVTTLIASSIGQYGAAIAASPRHDLGVQYMRLTAEVARYANDGAKILIENGWMEQPPMAANRKDLAK